MQSTYLSKCKVPAFFKVQASGEDLQSFLFWLHVEQPQKCSQVLFILLGRWNDDFLVVNPYINLGGPVWLCLYGKEKDELVVVNLKVFTRNIPDLSCLSSLGFCLSSHVFFGLVYGREQSHLKITLVNDHVFASAVKGKSFSGLSQWSLLSNHTRPKWCWFQHWALS